MSNHSKAKNLVHVTTHAVAPLAPLPESTAVLSAQDKLFSVLRLIQAMSKPETCKNPNGADFVKGDVILHPERVKVADYKNPFNVIFLRNTLEWANFELIGAKEEWRSEDKRIDAPELAGGNEHWPLEFTQDGRKMKRYRQITLFVLLPAQVEAYFADALSDAPSLSGGLEPVAIKLRNYSRKAAQEIIGKIGSKEFELRNVLRAEKGLAPLNVFDYEHVLQVLDKTNAKGTFQVLNYVKSIGVQNPRVKELAAKAHSMIATKTDLKTVVVEEVQAASTARGDVSDEV